MTVKVQWEDAFDKVHTEMALKVDDLGKGHYLAHWIGGGTTHFAPADNFKVLP